VQITWTAPNNNGAEITAYIIQVASSSGDSFTTLTCGTDLSMLSCNVYMNDLTALNGAYQYTYGQTIVARARAENSKGFGLYSNLNSDGAAAETVPMAVSTPIRGVNTTQHRIQVRWNALETAEELGGPSVNLVTYQVEWDRGTGDDSNWQEIDEQSVIQESMTSLIVTQNISSS
jgi:hypothetical protein